MQDAKRSASSSAVITVTSLLSVFRDMALICFPSSFGQANPAAFYSNSYLVLRKAENYLLEAVFLPLYCVGKARHYYKPQGSGNLNLRSVMNSEPANATSRVVTGNVTRKLVSAEEFAKRFAALALSHLRSLRSLGLAPKNAITWRFLYGAPPHVHSDASPSMSLLSKQARIDKHVFAVKRLYWHTIANSRKHLKQTLIDSMLIAGDIRV
jgi:hypothetical protein